MRRRYFLSAGVAKANTGKLHLEYSVRQCLEMCSDVCTVSSLELLGELWLAAGASFS